MNDVTPPRHLPKPPPRPAVNPRTVQPVAPPPPPKPEPTTTEPRPLGLPPAHVPLQLGKPKRKWKKWLLVILAALILLVAAGAAAGYFWYVEALKPRSSSTQHVHVVVKTGESADQVAGDLENLGVIKSAFALQIYIKLNGKGDIKAGSYVFTPSQQPSEIIQWLQEGRVDTFKVTILPGKTLAELKADLTQYGFKAEDIDAAFKASYDSKLLSDKPAGASLEGYIYPDTYYATSDTSVGDVLKLSFNEFEKQIEAKNLRATLAQRNFTLYQGITLASIVEKEVTKTADQRQVAQVFEKRLALSMPLGSDVTYHYAASLLGVEASPDIDSPYNTRKYTGLPPGPIANFNLAALEAVADPAPGDYLFFVAGDDGVTHFAQTLDQHNANVAQYCKKLCASN